jgi:epsilon-lactone hydrolase
MPLHPQARAVLDQGEALGLPKLNELPPEQAREVARGMIEFVGAGPELASVENITIPTSAGEIPGRRYTPEGAAGTLMWIHGGGWVICDLDTHDAMCRLLAKESGCEVIALDYRLAPEHPFPAAVEDSVAAYRWMLTSGLKASRIAIAGDSAGGGLTVATLVAIRDAKLATPAAGVCLSPWTDLEGLGDSMKTKSSVDPMVQKEALLEMAAHYLAGQDARHPLAAPLYADLAGLPPLLIQVGTAETLMDDSTRLAERARKAGVKVTLEPWENMIHVFQVFAPMLEEGQQAIEKIGEFVRANAA